MTKINQEEYEVLKELVDKYKWISRDGNNVLWVYAQKPQKDTCSTWQISGICVSKVNIDLFQFIQWEDPEPHNIQELIKEYEYHNETIKLTGGLSITQAKYDKYLEEHVKELENESEETEVKNIEWLKKEFDDLFNGKTILTVGRSVVDKILDQLDEPEVLSDKWIDDNSVYASSDGVTEEYVHVDDLQNLLVPKRELPVIPKFVADWIVECKEIGFTIQQIFYQVHSEYKQNIMSPTSEWINENEGLFAESYLHGYEVEEEQKYYVVKSEGLDGVHYYFIKFNDEMNGLFTLPNDKKGAYRFDDKEKAQAIANYTDSKVEELE